MEESGRTLDSTSCDDYADECVVLVFTAQSQWNAVV